MGVLLFCFSFLNSVFYSPSFHLLSYYISIWIFILLTHCGCIHHILSKNCLSFFFLFSKKIMIVLICNRLFRLQLTRPKYEVIWCEKKKGLYKFWIILNKNSHSVTEWRKRERTKVKKRQMFHCGILPSKNLFEAKCVSQSLHCCRLQAVYSSVTGKNFVTVYTAF